MPYYSHYCLRYIVETHELLCLPAQSCDISAVSQELVSSSANSVRALVELVRDAFGRLAFAVYANSADHEKIC